MTYLFATVLLQFLGMGKWHHIGIGFTGIFNLLEMIGQSSDFSKIKCDVDCGFSLSREYKQDHSNDS